MVNFYKLSKFAAITSAVLMPIGVTVGIVMGFQMLLQKENPVSPILQYSSLTIAILGVILTFIILSGYYKISQQYKSNFLKSTIFLTMLFSITTIGVLIWNLFFKSTLSSIFSFVNTAIMGIIFILFGVAFLKLSKLKNKRRQTISLLYIIMGGLQVTILLLFFAPFLAIAVRIIEFLFFKEM